MQLVFIYFYISVSEFWPQTFSAGRLFAKSIFGDIDDPAELLHRVRDFHQQEYLSQKTTPIDSYKRQISFQAACQPVIFGGVRPLGQNAVGTISSLPKRSTSPLKEIRMASHFYIQIIFRLL